MHKTAPKNPSLIRTLAFALILALLVGTLALAGCKRKTTEDLSFETFGKITEYSTYAKGEVLNDTFYYKEAWFGEDPKKRNDSLALLSMQLSAAAVTKEENGAGAEALRALGFDSVGFVGFETTDPDDCAYTWARKQCGDQTLVAIVFQSYALDSATKAKGWTQNFHVNDESASGEHAAFKKASEKMLDGILSIGGEGAKYWIMGQSRAGAIANLTAAKLSEKIKNAEGKIYAYTFEAPATTDADLAAAQGTKYAFIHNYTSSDDIVPLVPMWGMTLYGNRYEVKSEETEKGLAEELKKIGSSAADVEFWSNEEKIRTLVNYLENRLSSGTASREDYSKVRQDVCKNEKGESVTLRYSYQEVMEHLMHTIFSGELSGIDVENLEQDLSVLASSVYALAAAVKGEDKEDAVTVATHYYQAAQGIRSVMNGLLSGATVSLTDLDLYALLRLAGPLMLDVNYEEEGDPRYDVAGYIYPTIDLAQSFGNMSYAHHFDTVIARLKTLAPQPKAPDLALSLSQPKAGDPASALPNEFVNGVKGLNLSWISVEEIGWNAEGETIRSGTVYYLEGKVKVVGHLLSDDFKITINGASPIEVTSGYESGVCVVNLRWEFAIGTAEKVTLRFESGHGVAAPREMTVDKGKMLRYLEKPAFAESAADGGKTFLFDAWKGDSGAEWDNLTASEDLTLTAHWIRVIDEVSLFFEAPSVGGEGKLPTLPEDAPYRLAEYNVMDEEYHFIEIDDVTKKAGEYQISLFYAAIEGESVFAEKTASYDDYEETIFAGTVKLNGEAHDDYFYDNNGDPVLLSVGFSFIVK